MHCDLVSVKNYCVVPIYLIRYTSSSIYLQHYNCQHGIMDVYAISIYCFDDIIYIYDFAVV